MYRPVYYVTLDYALENYQDPDVDRFPDLISESGPSSQRFSRENTHKTIRDVLVHTAVRPQTPGGVTLR